MNNQELNLEQFEAGFREAHTEYAQGLDPDDQEKGMMIVGLGIKGALYFSTERIESMDTPLDAYSMGWCMGTQNLVMLHANCGNKR